MNKKKKPIQWRYDQIEQRVMSVHVANLMKQADASERIMERHNRALMAMVEAGIPVIDTSLHDEICLIIPDCHMEEAQRILKKVMADS